MPAWLPSPLSAALVGLVVTAALVPLARAAWVRLGRPDRERSLRKVHAGEIPRAGGAAVLLAVLLALLTAEGLGARTLLGPGDGALGPAWSAWGGAMLVGLAGLWDDLVGLRARHKLAIQVLAAALVVAAGVRWPALESLFDRNWVSLVLTVGFLVAATNAVNLIDGLDGLAGGVLASGFAVVVGASLLGAAPPGVGWLAALALGACLGFLLFNRHPARVFLGDGGAFFLGFLLATLLLSVGSVRPRKALVELSIPLMALALPLLDTTLAIVRRLVRGQPVFAPDADHLHHRLLARGMGTWRAVAILWAVQGWFAAMAYLTVRGVGGTWTLAGAVAMSGVLPLLLGYHRRRRAAADMGWLARRKETVELLRRVEALAKGPTDRGATRWRRLGPEVVEVLACLGFSGFEVRADGEVLASGGTIDEVRAWLDLPMGGGVELRVALTEHLTMLLPDAQQHVLEQVLHLLAGDPAGRRVSADDHPAARPGPTPPP